MATTRPETTKHDSPVSLDDSSSRLPQTPSGFAEALMSLTAAPLPSALFPDGFREKMVPETLVGGVDGVNYRGFRAWPLFLDAGWRGVPGAVFNRQALAAEFPDYLSSDSVSTASSAITEASRNVAQHGRVISHIPPSGSVCFAPGAIFLKEFACLDRSERPQRFLMCMVSDEGMGIADPSRSLVPGVGSSWGENHNGLGYELCDSVMMLIRSRAGKWLLFDGLHHAGEQITQSRTDQEAPRGVPPVAELALPIAPRGCQKIFGSSWNRVGKLLQ